MKARALLARRIPALLVVTAGTFGCASWHTIGKESPAVYVAREKPDVVRLSLGDSSLVLSRPAVHGDSVFGLAKSVHPHRWASVRGDEIHQMEIHSARGTTRGKITAGAIMTGMLLLGVAVALTSTPGPVR